MIEQRFPNGPTDDDWAGTNRGEAWLLEQGYSLGPMQGTLPRAIICRPGAVVPKWRNLSEGERERLDGQMTPLFNDYRRHGCAVTVKDPAELNKNVPAGRPVETPEVLKHLPTKRPGAT